MHGHCVFLLFVYVKPMNCVFLLFMYVKLITCKNSLALFMKDSEISLLIFSKDSYVSFVVVAIEVGAITVIIVTWLFCHVSGIYYSPCFLLRYGNVCNPRFAWLISSWCNRAK